MKGRPKTVRKISGMPAISGFKPYGGVAEKQHKDSIFLLYEEYEALRLCDYEKHSQCESAAVMQVSRPTLTRIYMSAREKIAKAFVEGRRIIIEGGKVELDGDWYVCHHCKAIFSNEGGEDMVCALCGSSDIEPYQLLDNSNGEEAVTGTISLPFGETDDLVGLKMEAENSERKCKRRRCRRKVGTDESEVENL